MKKLNYLISLSLAILITSGNLFRYNLPVYLNNISVFDILNLIVLGLTLILSLFKDKSVLTEGLIIFNIIGVIDSIVDELWFDPTHIGKSDGVMLITSASISFVYGLIRYYRKGYY